MSGIQRMFFLLPSRSAGVLYVSGVFFTAVGFGLSARMLSLLLSCFPSCLMTPLPRCSAILCSFIPPLHGCLSLSSLCCAKKKGFLKARLSWTWPFYFHF